MRGDTLPPPSSTMPMKSLAIGDRRYPDSWGSSALTPTGGRYVAGSRSDRPASQGVEASDGLFRL